jgi:hypothetical protein
MLSDTGRNENRVWCYLASDLKSDPAGFVPEPGVERVLVPRARIAGMILNGEFDFSLHVAALMLATLRHGADLIQSVPAH